MRKLQYFVTGTGRCGTVYLANLLTKSRKCVHPLVNSCMDEKPEYLFEDVPSAILRRELRDLAERYGYPLSGTGSLRRQLWQRMEAAGAEMGSRLAGE